MAHHQILHKSTGRKQSQGVTNHKTQDTCNMQKDKYQSPKKNIRNAYNAKMIIAFLSHNKAITKAFQADLVFHKWQTTLTGLLLLLSR